MSPVPQSSPESSPESSPPNRDGPEFRYDWQSHRTTMLGQSANSNYMTSSGMKRGEQSGSLQLLLADCIDPLFPVCVRFVEWTLLTCSIVPSVHTLTLLLVKAGSTASAKSRNFAHE